MLNAHQSCIPSLQKAVLYNEKQAVFRKAIIVLRVGFAI